MGHPPFRRAGDTRLPANPSADPLPDPDGTLARWLASARVEPVSAKEWILCPWFEQGPRRCADVNWVYIVDGHGCMLLGEHARRVPFRAGDLIIIKPGELFVERRPCRRQTADISVHFTMQLLGQLDLVELMGFPSRVRGLEAFFGPLCRRLVAEDAHRPPAWRLAMEADIRLGMLHVIRHCGRLFAPPRRHAAAGDLVRFLPAQQCLEERLGDPALSVGMLARATHLSEVAFRTLCRRVTGMSPVQCIQQGRIRRACLLLDTTERPAERISAECGFRDVPFFYRIFRKWMGQTPGAYRSREFR